MDFTLTKSPAIFLCEGEDALYLLLTSHKTEVTNTENTFKNLTHFNGKPPKNKL